MVNIPFNSNDQSLVKIESEQKGSSRRPFPLHFLLPSPSFSLSGNTGFRQEVPSFYFKYNSKADFDSSRLHEGGAGRRDEEEGKRLSLSGCMEVCKVAD